jgi:hypothetical protein
MPKFGQTWFNGSYFGEGRQTFTPFNKEIHRVPLGFEVRKQFGKVLIFRVRRGNGYYGSELGKKYQDKFAYVVPSSINNAEGQSARDALATAVSNWKNVLTDEQKAEYNRRAMIKRHLSGYNLYVGEYVKAAV